VSANAARDVIIRRARVHVVRRGGWSWGADTQALINSVKRALPALLSHIIEHSALQSVAESEITTPVKVRVSLRLADFVRLAAHGGANEASEVDARIVKAIADLSSIASVLGSAAPSAASERERSAEQSVDQDDRRSHEPAISAQVDRSARALLLMLRQWERDGDLMQRCSTLPSALLTPWLEHLRAQWPTSNLGVKQPSEAQLDRILQQVQDERVLLPAGEQLTLVRRVILAVRLFAASADRSQAQRLLAATLQQQSASDSAVARISERDPSEADDGRSRTETLPAAVTVATHAIPSQSATSREFAIDIPSALPFLLLGPLSKIGYLDALQVASNVAGGSELPIAFAAALAYKVLQPPQRGWYREAAQRHTAGAFAGIARIPEDQEIAAAAHALRTQTPLFDQLIAANLIQGHRADAPWLLCVDERQSFILFDADGLFPVAVGTPQALATSIAPSGSPLYVARGAATASAFEVLDGLQIPYVSRSRISSHGAHQGRMRVLAERGEDRCERAMAAWHAIRFDRLILRQPADAAMDTSLTLAASLALGTIAWTLWREREATDPLLALERFDDLDARIHSTATTLHVRLPLGRRFWDLRDHGLLADVREVPWLDGRVVTFGAG